VRPVLRRAVVLALALATFVLLKLGGAPDWVFVAAWLAGAVLVGIVLGRSRSGIPMRRTSLGFAKAALILAVPVGALLIVRVTAPPWPVLMAVVGGIAALGVGSLVRAEQRRRQREGRAAAFAHGARNLLVLRYGAMGVMYALLSLQLAGRLAMSSPEWVFVLLPVLVLVVYVDDEGRWRTPTGFSRR
jgi:hypothetical protein